MAETSEARKRASAKYDVKMTTGLYLKLNKKTDEDILCWLNNQSNKQGYIKELIRKDMERWMNN